MSRIATLVVIAGLTGCLTAGTLTSCGCDATTDRMGEQAPPTTTETVTVSDTTRADAALAGATSEATLTNGTGTTIVRVALRLTGTTEWPTALSMGDLSLADGESVVVRYPAPTSETTDTYDVMLTTQDEGSIIVRGVDLTANDITLRFDEGIGYTTLTDADGQTVSTYDGAAEADMADSSPTYDLESQLD